jgi:acyl-homoserine-lactone acylase
VAALAAAARRIEESHGALDVAWGDVHRLRRDGIDLPGNGGPGALGVFRTVGYDSAGGGRFVATGGDSFVAAVEFGTPLRAMALVGYGNWSQQGSPHRTDQLSLFARKELRRVWITRQEVEAHLERREQL